MGEALAAGHFEFEAHWRKTVVRATVPGGCPASGSRITITDEFGDATAEPVYGSQSDLASLNDTRVSHPDLGARPRLAPT